jgi:anionic cell wall polymer biosynthesis LytR-Cps2A-Psr (LCP) family protein
MGDIGRVKRQQNFMKALAKQAFTVTNMVKLPMIIGTATEYVYTDMVFIQLVKAANSLRAFGDGGVNSASLKGDFGDIGGVSYWVTTPSKIAATLDELKIPHKKIPSI